ncbi:Methyltransferase domain-containing protein [Natronoarchaeum philippinense]|uniref:Methyltransferase domain-containing protein n=1 Tax=Natronoarchaeum philippinense TaxID=558529 RepID=A0A285N9G3_NATPI|nr:class I SAM-dependent methyltransferase [Natronoarchaeum philippinense]SNZ06060.1 Methyltransferase domain-containing protein [Natronoarchaeum philippinense]
MDPSDNRRFWAERSGEYSPDYYAHRGPDETSEAIRAALDGVVAPSDPILELGCSAGRHLAHLHDHGFESLHGLDINEDAFDVMAETYPDLADAGTFHVGAIEEVVEEFDTDQFAAVFSVETLQHVHPDATDAFAEVARIASDRILTVENEGDHREGDPDVNYVREELPLYYRDWDSVFGDLGFEQISAEPTKRDTLRTFRPRER